VAQSISADARVIKAAEVLARWPATATTVDLTSAMRGLLTYVEEGGEPLVNQQLAWLAADIKRLHEYVSCQGPIRDAGTVLSVLAGELETLNHVARGYVGGGE
jgi:hypothetical protein